MARDYVKRDSRQPANRNNFTWLVVGILVGLIVAGLVYLKQQVTSSIHPRNRLVIQEAAKSTNSKNKPDKAKSPAASEDKVNFDFYTILPNAKVKDSAVNNDTATDNSKKSAVNADKTAKSSLATVSQSNMHQLEQNLLSPGKTPVAEDQPTKSTSSATAKHDASTSVSKPTVAKKPEVKKAPEKSTKSIPVAKHESTAAESSSGAPVIDLTAVKQLPAKSISKKLNAGYIVQIAAFKRFEDADQLKAQLTLAGYEAKIKVVTRNGITWHRVWLGPYSTVQNAAKMLHQLAAKHVKGVVVKVK